MDGFAGTTSVAVLIVRAAAALGLSANAEEVALLVDSRLLRQEDTLAAAGVASGDVVYVCCGEEGGMPGFARRLSVVQEWQDLQQWRDLQGAERRRHAAADARMKAEARMRDAEARARDAEAELERLRSSRSAQATMPCTYVYTWICMLG